MKFFSKKKTKVKNFEDSTMKGLEEQVNTFAETHNIKEASQASRSPGLGGKYTQSITYEEKNE